MLKQAIDGNRWIITTIIMLLVALITFLGGRYSVIESIHANASTNQLQDQKIGQIDASIMEQGKKLDSIHTIVIRLDQKLSD